MQFIISFSHVLLTATIALQCQKYATAHESIEQGVAQARKRILILRVIRTTIAMVINDCKSLLFLPSGKDVDEGGFAGSLGRAHREDAVTHISAEARRYILSIKTFSRVLH